MNENGLEFSGLKPWYPLWQTSWTPRCHCVYFSAFISPSV